MSERIYLDAHATTPVDPTLLHQYETLLADVWGNPSSPHAEGRAARGVLIEAKESIRSSLKVPRQYEIFFFSSATEAVNTLIKGIVRHENRPGVLLSTEVEHAAVFESIRELNSLPHLRAHSIDVGMWGAPRCADVASFVEREEGAILLAAFMAANNETGVVTDELSEIAPYLSRRAIPLVVDGVAILGKRPVIFYEGISAYIFSGHKIHAPKGIAVAVVDKGLRFSPLIVGGPQENRKRAGTENVALASIFSEAVRIAVQRQQEDEKRLRHLQVRFETTISTHLPTSRIHGHDAKERLPSLSHVAFPGIDGEDLLMALDMEGVAASHGSACSAGALEPSRVLLKMGVSQEIAASSLRFSWSRTTTEQEIEEALRIIVQTARRLKGP